MAEIIERINQEFVREALNSPVLLSDLAHMEKYISESYSGRSVIELLQNADDAGADRFFIRVVDEHCAIIANNGRVFTETDIYSLCRSGASTKRRKSDTIGFRGIGFKSVVNYSNQVHLVSGDIQATFSKKLSREILRTSDNIPLIRIPHSFHGEKYINEIRNLLSDGYKTVFVFEIQNMAILDEIKDFDSSCMLFLKNIRNIDIYEQQEYHFDREISQIADSISMVEIGDNNQDTRKWLVCGPVEYAYAFKMDKDCAVEADEDERVIHSFMPTRDKFCIPCKINGDFSTDPSRTKVVMDEETRKTIEACADNLIGIIKYLHSNKDVYYLMGVISAINVNTLLMSSIRADDFNSIFIKALKNRLKLTLDESILLRPDWLSEKSFLEIGKDYEGHLVDAEDESNMPGVSEFLRIMDFPQMTIDMALDKAKEDILEDGARVELLSRAVEKTKFTMDNSLKDKINDAYLLSTPKGVLKTKDIADECISEDFYAALCDNLPDEQEFAWFAKKLKIDKAIPLLDDEAVDKPYKANNTDTGAGCENKVDKSNEACISSISSDKIYIRKWESVEKMVMEFLGKMAGVKEVRDVAKSNLGYDAEVIMEDGTTYYAEIKYLHSMGASFNITNNEYSTANQLGDKYKLVLACMNSSEMRICMIEDPINKLTLVKKVVQWNWICDNYEYRKNMLTAELR